MEDAHSFTGTKLQLTVTGSKVTQRPRQVVMSENLKRQFDTPG